MVAIWTTRTLLIPPRHRQESVPPKDVVLEDCLTWQAMFTVHGKHFLWISFAAITFAHKKPHSATLFYRGTRIQGRRHLVMAARSLQSCAYRSLRVTIKLDSAAIYRWQFPALTSKTWVATWICNLLIELSTYNRGSVLGILREMVLVVFWRTVNFSWNIHSKFNNFNTNQFLWAKSLCIVAH